MAFSVRTITADEHVAFNATQPALSFPADPGLGEGEERVAQRVAGLVRRPSDSQVGAGLVLYRQLPKIKKYLAYLPEGPVIDWTDGDLAAG